MTVDELSEEMKSANDVLQSWNTSNGDFEDLGEAIYNALERNREAIIKYIAELDKE